MTHAEATQLVLGKTNRGQRKVGNNTYAFIEHDGTVAIELHGTKVVRFFTNGLIQLNSGGWQTSTTKDRINKFTNAGVYQRKREWFLRDGTPFEDKMLISGG